MGNDEMIKKVSELEMDWIYRSLISKEALTPEEAHKAVEQYRVFLKISAANPGMNIPITKLGDKAWHIHILNTRKYAEDCQNIFGEFLHHDADAFGTEGYKRAIEATNQDYLSFGVDIFFLNEDKSTPVRAKKFEAAMCLRT